MLVEGFANGFAAVELVLGGRAEPVGGGRGVIPVPYGRTGAGRTAEEVEAGGRAGAVPIAPVIFPSTVTVGGGRIGVGRATEGPVLGGLAATATAGLGVSVTRGTIRFGTGGSILDDDDEDVWIIGGRSGVALNGVIAALVDTGGALLGAVVSEAFAALAALRVASASSVAASSFRAFSFLRSPFDFFCFFLGGSRPFAIASSASSCCRFLLLSSHACVTALRSSLVFPLNGPC